MIKSKKFCSLAVAVLLSTAALAQPGGGGDPGHGQPVPISGLFILLGAGAALGIGKLLKKDNP